MPESHRSPVPPGAFLELDTDLVDEGRMRRGLDRAIKKCVREIIEYEREVDSKDGKGEVALKLIIRRAKGAEEHFEVIHETKIKTPTPRRASFVRERAGRLLCQPTGSNSGDPDQQLLFDGMGRVIGGGAPPEPEQEEIDTETGEVSPVVGRIRRAQG